MPAPIGARSAGGWVSGGSDSRTRSVDLKIPKLRKGSYFPGLLEPRRTAEKALTAVVQEAYIQGAATLSPRKQGPPKRPCAQQPKSLGESCDIRYQLSGNMRLAVHGHHH